MSDARDTFHTMSWCPLFHWCTLSIVDFEQVILVGKSSKTPIGSLNSYKYCDDIITSSHLQVYLKDKFKILRIKIIYSINGNMSPECICRNPCATMNEFNSLSAKASNI